MLQSDSFPGLADAQAWPAWVAFALPLAGVVAGLVLLLMGGRLLRPGLVILGVFAGVGSGILLSRSFAGERLLDLPLELLLPALGALVGGAVALALYRFAMALGAAASFAGLGALVTIVVLAVRGADLPPTPETPSTARLLASPAGLAEARRLVGAGSSAAVIAEGAKATAFSYWSDVPSDSRAPLTLGVLAGGVIGLLCGSMFPRFTGAFVTGLGGSAAILACSGVLASRLDPGLTDGLTPLTMLAAWAVLGVFGSVVQLAPGGKAAAAPAPA